MKVLFVTKSITTIGGVQRVVISLANSLSKHYDVTIISDDNAFTSSIYELNKKVKREDINTINNNFFKTPFVSKVIKKFNRKFAFLDNNFLKVININLHYKKKNRIELTKYINTNEFDVVIAVQGDMSMYLSLIANDIKAKTIGWNHSSFSSYYYLKDFYYYGQSCLFKFYLKNLDRIVVLSEYDKKCFKDKWDIDVIDITNVKSFTSNVKSELNKKNFLAVGRFTHAKGFDILIEAFSIFSNENKDYRLTIIGDGKLEKLYVDLIKKHNLNKRVFILNNISDIRDYLMNCCGLIMSSRWEGLGMVMVEAFEMGVPVIAFDLPSIKDYLITNYNGIKCHTMDSVSLAKAIESYININYKELQNNCKTTALKFDEGIITEKWIELINSITKPLF